MKRRDFFSSEPMITSLTGGRWVCPLPEKTGENARFRVSTDSRVLEPGDVFVALRGEKFDGHDFLKQAEANGAVLVIIDREEAAETLIAKGGTGVLIVKNAVTALGQLAKGYRETLNGLRVVAVTGSNGKTTTKRLIHAGLSVKMRGSASPKSFNNHIGVPLTVLAAEDDDEYLVAEIGSNAKGEIRELAEIVQPEIAVITTIGISHVAGLGSLRGVCEEKLDLLRVMGRGGKAVLNTEAPLLQEVMKEDPVLRGYLPGGDEVSRWFSLEKTGAADLYAEKIRCRPGGTECTTSAGSELKLKLLGRHNAGNALAALLTIELLGVEAAEAIPGMERVLPEAMRFTPEEVNGITFYNDAYNANPDSTRAALRTFAEVTSPARDRVIVLGDMLELGEVSEEAHREIACFLVRMIRDGLAVRQVILTGEMMEKVVDEIAAVVDTRWTAASSGELAQVVYDLIKPGDQVLLKGSRGLSLERIAEMTGEGSMDR